MRRSRTFLQRLLNAVVVALLSVDSGQLCLALQPPTEHQFLEFIRRQAIDMRQQDRPAGNRDEWEQRRVHLRRSLLDAWGGHPVPDGPPRVQLLGVVEREQYHIERLLIETLPDVWMTANAWVPKRDGKQAAVLCVHGHWKGARVDPHVQARCAGLASLGFFVLAVDAFGAGERGVEPALGEYHGEMTAATLLPAGKVLCGIQVFENMRAADYLQSRPEVDGDRLGITGASGGGNQTMYAGAWDERFRAVVPVCSVGNYQAYLGAACCMCETVPGALRFTEEDEVLALVAPRGLMVISAARDAFQFSVAEAQKSIGGASRIFQMYGAGEQLRHVIIESGHDYNQEMREAMYGFMLQQLNDTGDGAPVPEPETELEDPEVIRCFPGNLRPAEWITLPAAAARISGEVLKESAGLNREERVAGLERVLGGTQVPTAKLISEEQGQQQRTMLISPEPGIVIQLTLDELAMARARERRGIVLRLIADSGTEEVVAESETANVAAQFAGQAVLQLRATGAGAWANDKVGRAVDHNTAEWSLWLGRPLVGQWVADIRAVLTVLEREFGDIPVSVHADGSAAVAAVFAAALSPQIDGLQLVNLPSSFVVGEPWLKLRLGVLVPGILREAGDISDLIQLTAPRPLAVHGLTGADGSSVSAAVAEEWRAVIAAGWIGSGTAPKVQAAR